LIQELVVHKQGLAHSEVVLSVQDLVVHYTTFSKTNCSILRSNIKSQIVSLQKDKQRMCTIAVDAILIKTHLSCHLTLSWAAKVEVRDLTIAIKKGLS